MSETSTAFEVRRDAERRQLPPILVDDPGMLRRVVGVGVLEPLAVVRGDARARREGVRDRPPEGRDDDVRLREEARVERRVDEEARLDGMPGGRGIARDDRHLVPAPRQPATGLCSSSTRASCALFMKLVATTPSSSSSWR